MSILGGKWFKFIDKHGLPCVVLLDDIVSVYFDDCTIVETVHGAYECGNSLSAVIDFLGSYFNN